MSKVLNVNGDYIVRVQQNGNIILDTQSANGQVTIIGRLDVKGSLTYLESTNTQIKDNILQLNVGDQNPTGISVANNRQSGIEINRGTGAGYYPAQLLFNEAVTHYDPIAQATVAGTFVMQTSDGTLSGLQVASIQNLGGSNFVFDMKNDPYVLSLANATGYEDYVIHDSDIPNKKFINNYVAASNGVATVDRIYFPVSGSVATSTSSIEAFGSSIVFQINQQTRTFIDQSGLNIDNINLYQNTISNSGSDNLILTATNHNIEVNGVLNLDNQTWNTPTYVSGTTKVYSSSTVGPGGSGVYFTNDQAAHLQDELISRRRAVALSILL
jgi:hypothetical protein